MTTMTFQKQMFISASVAISNAKHCASNTEHTALCTNPVKPCSVLLAVSPQDYNLISLTLSGPFQIQSKTSPSYQTCQIQHDNL